MDCEALYLRVNSQFVLNTGSISTFPFQTSSLVEIVEPWQQPFLQVKPFPNEMVAASSIFAKQALILFTMS